MRCLLVGVKNANIRLDQEATKHRFIARLLAAGREACPQFPENDERQPDLIGHCNHVGNELIATKQIRAAIGVECNFH